MQIDCGGCQLRTLRYDDAASIAEHGNDRDIWLMLRDRFPHPFLVENAEAFIANAKTQAPPHSLGIAVDDEIVGMVSFIPGTDIERVNAEVGYWIGRAYWGRGIMTAALKGATQYAIREFGLTRVFAITFVHNPQSMSVLEKAGFMREGLMPRSAIKDGVVLDQYLYGYYA